MLELMDGFSPLADAAMTLSTEVVVIEIKALPGGRYEVFAEGLHQEAFEGCLGAIAVAQALASGLAAELLQPVTIATPWGERIINVPARAIEGILAKKEPTSRPDHEVSGHLA